MGFVCFSRAAPEGAHHLCGSLDAALDLLSMDPFMNTIENIFIIGGATVYTVSFSYGTPGTNVQAAVLA